MNRLIRFGVAVALVALAVGVIASAQASSHAHSSASIVSTIKKFAKKYAKQYAKSGPRGARGAQGAQGAQGPQGPSGAAGGTGPAGVAAFHTVEGSPVFMGTTCNSGSDCAKVKAAQASCPPGEVPTGGGYQTDSINVNIGYSRRSNDTTYSVIGINYDSVGHNLTAQVICARGAGIAASKVRAKQGELSSTIARLRAEVAAK
jgi:hypothetical protein